MNGMTLTIKGLFGHFNYEIPLYGLESVDGIPMSDGVTILTGANGYGKSTILRALEALSNGDVDFFVNLKFRSLSLRIENSQDGLTLKKTKDRFVMNGQELSFDEIQRFHVELSELVRNATNELMTSNKFQAVVQNGNSDALDKSLKEKAFDIYVQNYAESLTENKVLSFRMSMIRLSGLSGRTSVIPEQRLLDIANVAAIRNGRWRDLQEVTDAVKTLPERLKVHFSKVADDSSKKDVELNASFPSRVLNQSGDDRLTEEEFNRLYQDMNDKLRVLRENGLSDVAQQDIPVFQADKAGILRIFFDDFDAKYQVYEPLIAKLTLFRKILDRRFRTFKRVEISREYGLRVRDIHKDENGAEIPGDVIPLEKLSSGEQETLVLYYQLIFETAPGTMLLIDEPEISLHIAWQRHFIDELKEIVRLNDLRAVVATHSVSIIGRHRDIQVDLGALYQDELDR